MTKIAWRFTETPYNSETKDGAGDTPASAEARPIMATRQPLQLGQVRQTNLAFHRSARLLETAVPWDLGARFSERDRRGGGGWCAAGVPNRLAW
jgi:hypothetical protein